MADPARRYQRSLDAVMRTHGLSIQKVADASGCHRSTIKSLLDGGGHSPQFGTLEAIDAGLVKLQALDAGEFHPGTDSIGRLRTVVFDTGEDAYTEAITRLELATHLSVRGSVFLATLYGLPGDHDALPEPDSNPRGSELLEHCNTLAGLGWKIHQVFNLPSIEHLEIVEQRARSACEGWEMRSYVGIHCPPCVAPFAIDVEGGRVAILGIEDDRRYQVGGGLLLLDPAAVSWALGLCDLMWKEARLRLRRPAKVDERQFDQARRMIEAATRDPDLFGDDRT